MDKDKFRELLQTFEQLSVKPEADGDTELEAEVASAAPGTPVLSSRRSPGLPLSEPTATSEIDRFLDTVKENSTSFPELEATHPVPHCAQFKPSAMLKSISASEYGGAAGMRIQQQMHVASRFRLTAGLAARLYLQLAAISRDRTVGKALRARLAGMEEDVVAICSANLIEAGQIEARAQEDHAEELRQAAGSLAAEHGKDADVEGAGVPAVVHSAAAAAAVAGQMPLANGDGHAGLDSAHGSVKSFVAEDVALGARLSAFADAWPAGSTDAWVLSTVRHGLQFDFSTAPEHVSAPDPSYSAEESAAIEKVIRWDLGDRVIEEIPYRPDLFVSHMYTLRIGGKLKSLVEFRQLNRFLTANSIAVDETPSLCSLLRRNDWITRISIKCAYPSVPIHAEHRRFLVFKYDGRYYQYRAVPFGISVASRVFTRLLQAALRPLRAEGFRVTSHIDEICLLHGSCAELTEQTRRLCRHLVDLGFLINLEASDLVPQQNQRFLGFVFNTIDALVQFPKDQVKKVRRAAHTARSSRITAKQLASLLGKIRSIMPAVGPEPQRIREIEACLDASITKPESWDEVIPLSPPALAEIDWICERILAQKSMELGAECSLEA